MKTETYSKSVCDLMDAMENGALTIQQIAEAFVLMDDDELEQLGALLRQHGKPMVPRSSR